ncbi:MAG: Unknown protein [uncultured Sulfurovum sp.]|uniref:SHSP domain-containing protein n=1 Tax=uncultured Sulfurovum sp. TaxID=269237 RepID=A0A6S6U1S4_9BACT|nr:MAG: Unknown protein [uncultured Sulfurovum sp.]
MLNKKLSFFLLPLVATLSIQANDPLKDPFFQDPFGDDIFKEMMQMQQNMDKMFDKMHDRMQQRSTRLVSPLGTYKLAGKNQFVEKNGTYELMTNIPEHKENEINIKTQNGNMNITAKIIEKHENKTDSSYSSSSTVRMYQQSMMLPKDADEGTLKAEYRDAKLLITIKKKLPTTLSNTKSETPKNSDEYNKSKEEHSTKEQNIST